MSTTRQQRIAAFYGAGFRGRGLVVITCISECECDYGHQPCDDGGCNPDCCPPAPSCGQVQVYQGAHPGTAAEASTLAGTARLAWQISSGGTSFTAWTTYNNGCWQSKKAVVTAAVAAMPAPIGSAPAAPTSPASPAAFWVEGGNYVSSAVYPTGAVYRYHDGGLWHIASGSVLEACPGTGSVALTDAQFRSVPMKGTLEAGCVYSAAHGSAATPVLIVGAVVGIGGGVLWWHHRRGEWAPPDRQERAAAVAERRVARPAGF